jgi:RNA polymerase sigma factor (sigma-70 family)
MELLFIQQIIQGNVSKFSYFIETYKQLAYSIAFRILNNKEDTEEVVQDSFVAAYRFLHTFRGGAKFSTWFSKIVVNNALKKINVRHLKIQNIPADEIPEPVVEEIGSAYRKLARDEQKRFINQALSQLDMEGRLLLTLYYLHENSIEEMAEITSVSRENIKMKLHRGRKKMHLALHKILRSETKFII